MPTTHSDTTILGSPDNELFTYQEAEVASGSTIYPGMVVEKTGENSDYEETPTVQPVGTADKLGENFMVALTPDAPPRGSDTDTPINHEYDAGESIQIAVCQPGCQVQNALLADGSSLSGAGDTDVAYDDALSFNNDGALKNNAVAGGIVARAREAVDNDTGGGGVAGIDAARINIEVV